MMERATRVRALTPTDLMQRYLEQRAAIEAGDDSERYHAIATARILNATFAMRLTLEELEAWCRVQLGLEQG